MLARGSSALTLRGRESQSARTTDHGRGVSTRPGDGGGDPRTAPGSALRGGGANDAAHSRGEGASAAREGLTTPHVFPDDAAQRRPAIGGVAPAWYVLQRFARRCGRRAARRIGSTAVGRGARADRERGEATPGRGEIARDDEPERQPADGVDERPSD